MSKNKKNKKKKKVPRKKWLRKEGVIGVESHEVAEVHIKLVFFLTLHLHQIKPITNYGGVEGA